MDNKLAIIWTKGGEHASIEDRDRALSAAALVFRIHGIAPRVAHSQKRWLRGLVPIIRNALAIDNGGYTPRDTGSNPR